MRENEPSVIVTVRQVDPSPGALLLAEVIEKTKDAVPSGILHRTPPRQSILFAQDGSGGGPALTQDQWQAALDELLAGVTSNDVLDRADAHREGSRVPIYVAGFDYEAIRDRVWAEIQRIEESKSEAKLPFENTADLIESRRAFFASAVLKQRFAGFFAAPHTHYGLDVTFIVPPDALLGTAAGATELTIDFGDAGGPRTVRTGEPVAVRYASFGPKVVSVRLEGNAPRTAGFQFVLEESPFVTMKCPTRPPVGIYGPIEAPITRPDIERTSVVLGVMRSGGTTKLRKPLLLVEGFPGNYEWDDMWKYANKSDFACTLLERGYDLIFVKFPQGTASIQANAYALIGAIEWAKRERVDPKQKLIIGGFSMGGLVARYALAFMDHERKTDPTVPDHETGTFFTIDSPHEGANVPVSVQALAQAMDANGIQATRLRSKAAQQMLLAWVPPQPWTDDQTFGPSEERVKFLKELKRVGQMPAIENTIAVANGAANGKANPKEPGTLAMKYACTMWQFADLHLLPTAPDDWIFHWADNSRYAKFKTPRSGGAGYDSAPGGVFEWPPFAVAFARVPPIPKWNPVENAAFIPTVSALAIPDLPYFQRITNYDMGRSWFKNVRHCDEENREHVELTPTLSSFLLQHIPK